MALGDDLKTGKKALDEATEQMRELGSVSQETFTSISANMGGMLKDMKNSSQEVQDLTSSFKNQKSIMTELNNSAKIMAGFTSEDLKNRKKVIKYIKEGEKLTSKIAKLSSQIKINEIKLSRAKTSGNKELAAALSMQNEELMNAKETASELLNKFTEIKDTNDQLNNNTKVFDKMASTFESIPGLGPLIGQPLQNAAEHMRTLRVEGAGFGETMAAGAMDLAGAFGLPAMIGLLFDADNKTTNIMRGMQVSREEALGLKEEMSGVFRETGNALYHVENMHEGVIGLQKELGVASEYNEDMTKNFVFMTKRLGMSTKSAGYFSKYMETSGKDAKVINLEIANSIAKQKAMTGITFKLADVMDDVANTNAGLKAAYGWDNKLLAEMVVKTKALGINMEQAEKMASSLLDFESSISAEMEAEMLTGKDLNFEEARRLAMMGKSADAAAEMMKQVGGSKDLMKMNVIQTEALAKAMGMTRNELFASVKEKEMLNALGEESMEAALKVAESYEDEHERAKAIEEVKRKIKEHGGAELLATYERNSAQEAANAALIQSKDDMGKMLESMVNIEKVFTWINEHAEYLGYIISGVLIGGMISMVEKSLMFLENIGLLNAEKLRGNVLDAEGNAIRKKGYIATGLHWIKKKAINLKDTIHYGFMVAQETVLKGLKAASLVLGKKAIAQETSLLAKGALRLVQAIATAAAWVIANPIAGVIGLALAGTAVSYMASVKDGMINPKGGMVVSGEKGSIQLDKEDSIIAGTNLGGGGGGNTDNSEMVSLLKQIANKSSVIEMGGNEVGQGINTAERELQ